MREYATVFQAEVQAINLCAHELLNDPAITDKKIYIQVDSKATLHALKSSEITSKLVQETVNNLNTLAGYKTVKLRWIPAHDYNAGNDVADLLAREG